MNWRSIRTIPVGVAVRVKTVNGIVCAARTYPISETETRWVRRARMPYRPMATVHCYRLRRCKPVGDVQAVAWAPLAAATVRNQAK